MTEGANLRKAARQLAALTQNRLTLYRPYPKQQEFHALGSTRRERALLAANQSGKTWCAGFEVAIHLTGRYPTWWQGRRFRGPTKWWAASTNNESTRDNPQRILMGEKAEWGKGAIPLAAIKDVRLSRGIADFLDTVKVRHVSGGISLLSFKSYEQERQKWQGESLDGVWFDEEPPEDIYTEGLTRTNARTGCTLLTATPLLGMTKVVLMFWPAPNSPDRGLVQMTLEDAGHYTEEQIRKIVASYPPHEREARTKGYPKLGEGVLFPVSDSTIVCEPFDVPPVWPQIGALDFGRGDHPTAAVRMAWDKDADVLYLTHEYREEKATPVWVAAALRAWGPWLPWAWPADGWQQQPDPDGRSMSSIADQYRELGLRMLRDHAHFQDWNRQHSKTSVGLWAGIHEMLDRMQSGRWKVFSRCEMWLSEKNVYHQKEGKVVKVKDDLISASRYAMMMRRHAKTRETRSRLPTSVGRTDPFAAFDRRVS